MASLLALGYSMLVQPQETDEKTGADTPAVDDNTSKPDTRTPTPDPKHSVSTKSLPNPPSSFKGLPKLPDGESSRTPSRRPSFRRSSTKADADSESTRKGPSKESKRNKMHASAKELDDQYAKQMAKVAKLMRKMARAEQREKNARWKAAMQDITLAREAGLDPQKDKVGWDEDSEDEAAPAPRDDALKKPFTDLSTKPAGEDTPAPESGDALARFIHAMFSSVNPFEEAFVESKDEDTEPAATASQSAQAQSSTSTKDPKDAQADAEVLRMLSSASTMNQPSQNRRSVWNVLDRLTPGRPKKSGAGEEGSVMLSAPLFVTANSKVTVAQSEMQTIEEHESDTEDAKPSSSKFANLVARMGMDGMFGKKKREKEDTEAEKVEEPEMVIVESEQPKTKEVRVWRPSADGISLQCSWWGYRIYLPPAVIAVLNDQTLEAANRASIVTSALQWIIDNVPVAALGPQVGLVMSLIRGIIPAMGYIGGFVAWSWNTIVGFDQGDGVVLSATWLLPIALIPSAWDIEPVGMPTKAIEAGSTPEATLEPVPEPIPEIKSEPKPKSRSKSKSKPEPQPEPEVETMTAKPSHSRSASMARSMPTLERKASVKSSSTSSKEKKAERRVLERSTTTPVPIPNRPPHPPRQPTLAGPLPTPPSSLPRSSSSIKTHSRSHSQTRPQPHSRSQSQSYAPTPPVTKVKEPKPESDRHTLKRSTSKLGMNIVWSDKPVSEEPKEEVETESMKMRQFKLPMPDITWEHERKAAEAEAAAKYAEEQRIRMAEEEARKAKLKNKYAQALREEMAKDKPSPPVGWSLLS